MSETRASFTPAPLRLHRGRKQLVPATTPVVPFALTSATFDPGLSSVTLTFNQAIETGDIVLSVILVSDVTFTGMTMLGASLIGQTSNSVTVEMEYIAPASGSGVKLTVDAGNGIFPASGGDAWVGVNELALPFG